MFIAMNRFKIVSGCEAEFEKMWQERETYLPGVPGFQRFSLMRGASGEDHTLYITHTVWDSKTAFENWVGSDAFAKAHQQTPPPKESMLGNPVLEKFEAVLTRAAKSE